MEPSLNPDDIPALNAEYIDRRTRAEEQGEDIGTGDSFMDTLIEMSGKVGSDVVGSVKTGEIAEGPMLGIARAGFELMRLFGPGFIGGEGGVGDIGSKAMDIGIKKMETTTGQIAAFAAPYVITGTASILGAGSLAVKLGIGPMGKFLMQIGAGGSSDFAVGATMEPPDEQNIAHLIVQLAEADPDSALLQTAAPLFEYLASADDDPEIVKRLKRGAIEALTNVAAEVGFVAVKGIPMLVKGLKSMSGDGSLRIVGDSLEQLKGTKRSIRRQLHKEGVEGIDLLYGNEVKDPRQIEMMLAAGGQRLGVSLKAIDDMVKQSKAAGEPSTGAIKSAAETIGAGLGALFSTAFGTTEAEAGGTGKILATLAEVGLEPAEPFFSKAQRVVEETTTQRASSAQWRGTLKNAGVKDEEFEWLGLDGLLRGSEPVTKDDLATHIAVNKVQVKDITLGGEAEVVMAGDGSFVVRQGATVRGEFETREIAEEFAGELRQTGTRATKFDQYTLPGGENYRELLLQLPSNRTAITAEAEVVNAKLRDLIVQEPIVARRTPEIARLIDELRERRQVLHGLSAETPDFNGGHFDHPNVLAHVRFNERTIEGEKVGKVIRNTGGGRPWKVFVEGSDQHQSSHLTEAEAKAAVETSPTFTTQESVLFIEEVQSDWMAKGRDMRNKRIAQVMGQEGITKEEALKRVPVDFGFGPIDADGPLNVKPLERSDFAADGFEVFDESGRFVTNVFNVEDPATAIEIARRRIVEDIQSTALAHQLPNAPLKNTWHEMALKRMIRYAAENDFDRIGWTTGKQQQDRYDLSRQVDSVEVHSHARGGRQVVVIKDNDAIIDFRFNDMGLITEGRNEFVGKELDDVLGKELGEKVLAVSVPDDAGVGARLKRFSGLDLKIGGKGLKAFYDNTLTGFAKKFGKRFGTKPEMVKFGGDVQSDTQRGFEILEEVAAEQEISVGALEFGIRQGDFGPFNLQVADEDFDLMRLAAGAELSERDVTSFTAWSMRITDKLRETALKEGFPLFSAALAPLGAIPEPPGGDQ